MRLVLPITAACCFISATAAAQWLPQRSGTTAELRGLSVVDGSVAWASGTHGQVLHTTDGGRHWTVDSVPGAGALDFRDVQGASARSAWAMSSGDADKAQAWIYHTTSGGARWTPQYTTRMAGVFLDAIAFWDARHGIAMGDPVGGRFFLLETSDGGRSWTRIPPDRIPPSLPGEAAFAASGTCLAVQGSGDVWIATGGGPKARVFRSTNRGRTWTVADVPVQAGDASTGLFSVAFRDARHGVAVGGDYRRPNEPTANVAVTYDGGRSWRRARTMPTGYMSAVAYVPGTRATFVAVGLAGTALSTDDGSTWTMMDSVPYNSVAFGRSGAGWAAGPRGRIAKWVGARGSVRHQTDIHSHF